MAKDSKSQYVTIAPVTPKGKWTVASRRVGTRERLMPFCECRTEIAAEAIVDGLNALQKELTKIEVPLQRSLDETRAALHSEKAVSTSLRTDLRMEQDKVRKLNTDLSAKSIEISRLQVALKAAQEKAREEA